MSDTFDLKGRRALVTGASRGIGLAVARSLGRHGAPVHEIHDLPLWLAGDTAVRVLNETRQAGRMPAG